jgi:hypothetical protein
MDEREIPINLFICPKCKTKLIKEEKSLKCPVCKNYAWSEGRFFDFSQLTPKLPLYFSEYTKNLHYIAGEKMNDISDSWRINKIISLLEANKHGSACLEIGGGDGPLTPLLELLFLNVISLDFSPTFLKRIQSKTKALFAFMAMHISCQ